MPLNWKVNFNDKSEGLQVFQDSEEIAMAKGMGEVSDSAMAI